MRQLSTRDEHAFLPQQMHKVEYQTIWTRETTAALDELIAGLRAAVAPVRANSQDVDPELPHCYVPYSTPSRM